MAKEASHEHSSGARPSYEAAEHHEQAMKHHKEAAGHYAAGHYEIVAHARIPLMPMRYLQLDHADEAAKAHVSHTKKKSA